MTSLGKQDEHQGDSGRSCLYPQNPEIHCEGAEYARNDDACEEEDLDGVSGCAEDQAPHEPGGEKAIVQTLIGGKRFRRRCELGRRAEGSQTARRVPQEHFEDKKVEVQRGDQRHDK